jgi:predicted MFS family arabinose efflux permease
LADTAPAPTAPVADTVAAPAPATQGFGERAARRMFAAFTHRDFRLQWFGACTSSIGTWTQLTAQNWLVLSLTSSALYLGIDGFLQQLPIMLFTLIGGVMADRLDRRRTLVASQYIQMATAITLAGLVYFGTVRIWHILALSFITGMAQSFGGPAYQALIPSLVTKDDLPNAIAFNSIQFNIARVLGPLVFGETIAIAGRYAFTDEQSMAICFALNAISFVVVIYTLLSLRVKHIPPVARQRVRDELTGGLQYVRHHASLMSLVVLALMTTFLGYSVLTFLSIFVQRVFREGAETYGQLLAYSGAGSILGALIIAWLGKFKRMGATSLVIQTFYGALIVAFAISRTMWVSEILLFFIGAAQMVVVSSIMSLVQLIVPNEMRGRVMSIYMFAFRGGMPLGSLALGYVATFAGAPIAIGINGALLVVVGTYFLTLNRGVRTA